MNIESVKLLFAAVGCRNEDAVESFIDFLDTGALEGLTPKQVAALVGQCAHESARFSRIEENLNYRINSLMRVWPSRFPTMSEAEPFAHNPRSLANKVYGGRMGNTDADDGYRFRGRGWIQLTGKLNYTRYGTLVNEPLVTEPELLSDPVIAWQVAHAYFLNRKRRGLTVYDYADAGNDTQVTKMINGGTHGLDDRKLLTARAITALTGGRIGITGVYRKGSTGNAVEHIQARLSELGYDITVDGDFGPGTERIVIAYQTDAKLLADGEVGPTTLTGLGLA